MHFDLPLDQLQSYQPTRVEPTDFDAFWAETLESVRQFPLEPRFERVENGLQLIETYDVTFHGYAGQPIKGWFTIPKVKSADRLPCVVEFIGYGGGRGLPLDWLLWSSAGYAHLVMDNRGQGSSIRTSDTPDVEAEGSNSQVPGFMTRGILNPRTYYYRRLFSDAVRAVEAARSHPAVDADRVAVCGGSQGGGMALAVGGLVPDLSAVMADVPFLCHFRHATQIIDTHPYAEISLYCQRHRSKIEQVFQTLSYFDGVNFAARASAPALFSVGLMDDVCPPSTVFAAYNHYAGAKNIKVWHYNRHEGGETYQSVERLKFLAQHWG